MTPEEGENTANNIRSEQFNRLKASKIRLRLEMSVNISQNM